MNIPIESLVHSHNFLGANHANNEWRTWTVIFLCTASMIIEITCGIQFGSLALVADGIHMSTHALAFLITALAYTFSRKHSNNPYFVFGTGKIGELSSFSCAIILIGVAGYILYEGIYRFVNPEELNFLRALPVAFVGLFVNVASAAILLVPWGSGDDAEELLIHGHGHSHGHSHGHGGHSEYLDEFLDGIEKGEGDHHDDCGHDHHDHGHGHGHGHHSHGHHDEVREFTTSLGMLKLEIFEEDVPPEFRISLKETACPLNECTFTVKTIRPNEGGATQLFSFKESKEQPGL